MPLSKSRELRILLSAFVRIESKHCARWHNLDGLRIDVRVHRGQSNPVSLANRQYPLQCFTRAHEVRGPFDRSMQTDRPPLALATMESPRTVPSPHLVGRRLGQATTRRRAAGRSRDSDCRLSESSACSQQRAPRRHV